MNQNKTIKKSESEIKKINDQRLVEESDNKITQDLFSDNPHVIDKSNTINNNQAKIGVVKLDKNKFVSLIKPVIIEEKNTKLTIVKNTPKINSCYDLNGYDLNDYNYDFDLSDF